MGLISNINFLAERTNTTEEVDQIFIEESASDRYKFVVVISVDQLVSSDVVKRPLAAIIHYEMKRVMDGGLDMYVMHQPIFQSIFGRLKCLNNFTL